MIKGCPRQSGDLLRSRIPIWLELVPDGKLHFASSPAPPHSRGVRKLPEGARAGGVKSEGTTSIVEIDAVKDVESRSAKLQPLMFTPRHSKGLVNARVEAGVGWADQRVAQSVQARPRESQLVQRGR